MTAPHNPFSKEAQLSRSPGNRKKPSNKEKGATFEKEVASSFQKDTGKKARIGKQNKPGGGMGEADVNALPRWHFETKNEDRLRIPAYLKQLKEDCPKQKKPGLVVSVDEVGWLMIRLADKKEFAHDLIEESGGEVWY